MKSFSTSGQMRCTQTHIYIPMGFNKMYGSKLQVYRGKRTKTSGGLKKSDLKKNSRGRIVSKKASAAARRTNNLGTHKSKKPTRRSHRLRGKRVNYSKYY
jgi:hypothetical protein